MQEFVLKFHYKDENHLHYFDGRTEWLVEPKLLNERERGETMRTMKMCECFNNLKDM